MTNLVIDIGNTLSKVALFNNRTLLRIEQISNLDINSLDNFLKAEKLDNAIISSVKTGIEQVEEYLKQQTRYIQFTASAPSNVINLYKTPLTLGLDRYAAVIGAQAMFPGENCLVIDAGTCITYDFISSERIYSGGSISPGIKMRFKAMHQFTEKLPLVEPEFYADDLGSDTRTSLLTGVQRGVVYETLGFIGSYDSKWSALNVILCGGDVKFFDTALKSSIFAHTLKTEPHLVLIGLNEVIHYNND